MKRRPLLVALASGGLAGCSARQLVGGTSEGASESFESVSRRAVPTPPGTADCERARSFVRAHERSRTHNALVADAGDTIRAFSVRVARDDEAVFADTVEPSAPLALVPSVVSEPGRYRLTAALSETEPTRHEWDLPEESGPAWHWTSLLVTPGDDLLIRELSAARLQS